MTHHAIFGYENLVVFLQRFFFERLEVFVPQTDVPKNEGLHPRLPGETGRLDGRAVMCGFGAVGVSMAKGRIVVHQRSALCSVQQRLAWPCV